MWWSRRDGLVETEFDATEEDDEGVEGDKEEDEQSELLVHLT